MGDLSRSFSRFEFVCKCGCNTEFRVDSKLISILQKIRDAAGPILVTSGCRCRRRNDNTPGAAKNSWHVPRKGVLHAADIVILDPRRRDDDSSLGMWLIADMADASGIGIYEGGRVHVDTRPVTIFKGSDRARWASPEFEHWTNFTAAGKGGLHGG